MIRAPSRTPAPRSCATPVLATRLRREALARAEELDTGPMTDRYSKLFDAVLAGGPPR
jgi:hypothetical protein